MTAYKNYVQDFPNRCLEVLEAFTGSAELLDREVTILLAVATPCLILPYERLHKNTHSSEDRKRFSEAASSLNVELEKECGQSCLWLEHEGDAWHFKKLETLHGDPDAWGLDQAIKPIATKKTKTIVDILRNALAHGNIWTTGDPIKTLVFVSLVRHDRPAGPFKSLQCSPADLKRFVENWVKFLGELELPSNAVMETDHFAE